jgi:hypothetical protein
VPPFGTNDETIRERSRAYAPDFHAASGAGKGRRSSRRATGATDGGDARAYRGARYVEIETGVQGDRADEGGRTYSVPTVTKIGLTSHMQLNLNTPAFASGPGQSGGIGDVSVGLKWRLLDDHAVLGDFALLPAIKFPTGSTTKGTGSGTVDVGITAIASYDIHGVSMDLNAAYTRIGGTGSSAPSSAALWTASFGFPVSGHLSWVAEVFGQPTIDGSGTPSTAAFLTGPTYLVSTTFNVDAGVIAPFHGNLPNSVYAGLVWNVGSIWHP